MGDNILISTKKGKPFIRETRYIFNDKESAKNAKRDWESNERKKKSSEYDTKKYILDGDGVNCNGGEKRLIGQR